MKHKTICFISHGLAGGGMERALTSLANHFAVKGYDVTIINLYKTEVFFELDTRIKIIWPNFPRNNKLLYIFRIIPFIRKEIIKDNPEVIFSFGETFNSYVVIATRFLGIRLVLTNRMWPSLKLGFPIDQANWLFYRFADGIIAQTNKAREIISVRSPNKNIVVIPNAVKTIDVEITDKKNQIVSVGRLSHAKGHIELIKAFALLSNKHWELHLVGDGPERKFLEKEAEILEVSEKVIFHGHLKDFSEILAESSIYVLPSKFEGFPNSLVEAMSVPLACISSDCVAGPRDIINNNVNGVLYKTGDVEELTVALSRLIENPDLRNRLALEAYKVREQFHFEKIAQLYSDFIFNEK